MKHQDSSHLSFPHFCIFAGMNNFSHIIFDLDGTLSDNTRGIAASVKYALDKMQVDGFNGKLPDGFIGPPLQHGFKNLFGLNERNTQLAVEYFREYYSVHGLFENDPYPGVSEMLEELHFAGKQLFIATSKLEKFAAQISEHFGFDKYIVQLKGADYKGDHATKTTIISHLLESRQLAPSKNMAMVGDTVFDMEGGKENGLTTIAVSYGFGKREELQKTDPDFWADDVEELFQILR
ncbi:HAD hydrolase-like protein [Mariniphaga sp.]|uniref:HAD hydrolase-like protein n=1 Tax=Mariniphaga sp. TaxID=1954475 RepID=UPI0035623A8F